MPNVNAFEAVVHEKIFKDLLKFPPCCPLKWLPKGQPLDFNKSESHSLEMLLTKFG